MTAPIFCEAEWPLNNKVEESSEGIARHVQIGVGLFARERDLDYARVSGGLCACIVQSANSGFLLS